MQFNRFPSNRALLPAFALTLFMAADASAYCRLRTCLDDGPNECRRNSRGCVAEGDPLSYASPCLSFALAKGDGRKLGLSDREVLDAIQVAFERWRSVDCGDGSYPGFFVQSLGLVEAKESYVCEEPTRNASVWLIYEDWRLDPNALGNTSAAFEKDTGEIVDADVELNLEQIKSKTPAGAEWDALLAVATHEAGHVLGLDHSEVEGSLMSAEYAEGELVGRELTRDDVDGICDLYPPNEELTECPLARVPTGALDAKTCTGAILDDLYEADESDGEEPSSEEGCSFRVSKRHDGAWQFVGAFALGLFGARRLLNTRRKTPRS